MTYWQTTLALLAAVSASLALADDFKTIDGKEYKNVTVSRVEPDGIVLKSNSGVSKVYFTELPKGVQERFHYDAQQAAQYPAQTIEENKISRQQETEEAQKRAEQAAQLAMRRQQQQAEIERQQQQAKIQQRQEAEAERRQQEAGQPPQTKTAAQSTLHSRSQEGIPEHTYELLQDHTIDFGGLRIRLRRGEQYHGRILVDHAEIDRDGRSYTVPSGIVRPID